MNEINELEKAIYIEKQKKERIWKKVIQHPANEVLNREYIAIVKYINHLEGVLDMAKRGS